MSRLLNAVMAVAVASVLLAPPSGVAQTPGADGVSPIMNPETPSEEVTVELEELWRRGGEDDDILFGVLNQLVVDDAGEIYLLDSQLSEIQVFSPDGEFLRTVGREGEGPGEFRNCFDMFLGPDNVLGVVQVFPGKVVGLNLDGLPAPNYPLPEVTGGGFQLIFGGRGLSDRFVLAGGQNRQESGQQMQYAYLKAYAPDGSEIAHYYDELNPMQFGGMQFREERFTNFTRRWALADDGRVAVAPTFDDYRIHVWNPDGSLNMIIERPDFAPIPRDAETREWFQRFYDGITSWNPNSTFQISDYQMVVNQMWFREDGTLWVLSAAGVWECEDGELAVFDEYDTKGKFTRRIHVRGEGDPLDDGLFLVGDRMYVVTDLWSARMANIPGAGGEEDMDAEEPEPVSVIAYDMGSTGG